MTVDATGRVDAVDATDVFHVRECGTVFCTEVLFTEVLYAVVWCILRAIG